MIEPQVDLDKEKGVDIKSKPDFIIYPRNEVGRPIAVFTDGFEYPVAPYAPETPVRYVL